MNATKDILIVGVGGQGVLLASELLSSVAVEAGLDAKKSEVHGMSQRGGVVSSHVRFGRKVFSPLIPEGRADILLAFEMAEAQRWIHFLKDGGKVIVNDYRLIPPVAMMTRGGPHYPDDPVRAVTARNRNTTVVQARNIARTLGNIKLVNTILLGVLSLSVELPLSDWEKVIRERVPKGTDDLNWNAFLEGRKTKM